MEIMTRNQMEKYADTLIWGLNTARPHFKKYDNILIRFDLAGLGLAEIVHRKLIQLRYNPIMRMLPTPTLERDFYYFGDNKQIEFISSGEKELYENLNGYIYIHAPQSLTHLKGIDTSKQARFAIARKFIMEIRQKREAQGKFGWTLCTYPTEELAKQARLTLKEYSNQIIKACFLNEKDPVKKWKDIHKDSIEIKKWLNSMPIDTFHIESQNIDLTIKLGEKRKFLGVSGHNIPSFEIFTSPDYRGVEGVYYANLPTFRGGNYIEAIKLEFKKGQAIKISAKKGEEYLKKIMSTDIGAKQIGEFSMTDKRFSKIDKFMADILFDENHGGKYGNCHLAIGSAYLDTYDGDSTKLNKQDKAALGFNDSSIHWDMINTENKLIKAKLKGGKEITIYENGMFKY